MCQTYNVLREKGKIVSLAVGRLTKGARSWLVQILGPQLSIFPIFIVNFDGTVLILSWSFSSNFVSMWVVVCE